MKKTILFCLLIISFSMLASAASKDVTGVTMDSPTTDQSLAIDDTFTMSCSAALSGRGAPPYVTYAQQYCDASDCSGTVTTITINDANEVITLQSGSTNPEYKKGDQSQSNTAAAKNGGTVYVRCKVVGGTTCSGGCYSGTKMVDVSGGGCTNSSDCYDGDECTQDVCTDGVCSNPAEPDNTGCTGGICCSGACVVATCSSSGDCSDSNECTSDVCNNAGTCSSYCTNPNVADDTSCTGGVCCSGECVEPTCSAGADCADGIPCTTDTCSNAGTCSATCSNPDVTTCSYGDGCCLAECDYLSDYDCPPPEMFVTVNDTDFVLNGSTWKFAGTNNYYLWYKNLTCDATNPPPAEGCVPEVLDDAADLGLSAIRTWAFGDGNNSGSGWDGYNFQPSAGVYDEPTFVHFDNVIKLAKDRGLRLVLPLVNNWDDFGGMNQYVSWCGGGTHDSFYTSTCTKNLYKDYINYTLNRVNTVTGIAYKNDPTILAWELANEPRATSDSSGATMNNWVNEMSAYIKGIDSNHLVTTGQEGFYSGGSGWRYDGSQGTDYIADHNLSNIDYASYHLYPDHWGTNLADSLNWIVEHTSDAHNVLGKPVVLGEMGKQGSSRDTYMTEWYSALESNGSNGDLFWILYDHTYTDYDSFGVYCPENTSTCNLISGHAAAMSPCTSNQDCDDGNECTSDVCNVDGTCSNTVLADNTNCSFGVCCSGVCAPLTCAASIDCDDGNECTTDSCMNAGTCSAYCDNTDVADNTSCTGGICCYGTCGAAACSVSGDCDDSNECTTDTCLNAGTCSASCDNTNVADNTVCSSGVCCSGTCGAAACSADADCDDSNECTTDTCSNAGTCSASCSNTQITQCINADGCCPSGCDSSNDDDCTSASCDNCFKGVCDGSCHPAKEDSTCPDCV